ncbi:MULTISPECIES: ScbR family autoregulator-binding transcription factor [Rhodococcus]|uniref:ScbR family autoregulator-binding transcription factor n=1 Tax=Rhodococcus TaxID=1827 RepID=UPI0029533A4F|nr:MULTISPECIES: ScbR family autoregulator-binding transcription factor [Rhodococcus]MDV7278124.1 ScbR family autoregulator-binding transcription factor [Rhodococcus oxybenzonivorans]MDV8031329.1 ScbR family autoregulator-binding transcription factor [Rhodococcus sp. IEGM 27]
MARQVRAEVTRASVLMAAADVFVRLGYANAGLNEIIEQSGVTKGALYFHFSSKEDLARGVIDEGQVRLTAGVTSVSDGPTPALEALVALSYVAIEAASSDPIVAAMLRLQHEIGDYQGTDGNVVTAWQQAFERLVGRAVDEGDIRTEEDVPPETLATFLRGSLLGTHVVATATNAFDELPRRMERVWYFILPGLVEPSKLVYFRQFASRRLLR